MVFVATGSMTDLPLEVCRDPSLALDGGEDGLDLVRRLVCELPTLLRPRGVALLELGEGQADEDAAAAGRRGLEEEGRTRDLGGADRVLALRSAGSDLG